MKEELKIKLNNLKKEVEKREKQKEKMEEDGIFDSKIYDQIDELYSKIDRLQSEEIEIDD